MHNHVVSDAVAAIAACIEENHEALTEEYFKTAGRDEDLIAQCTEVLRRMNRSDLIEQAVLSATPLTMVGVSGRNTRPRRSGKEIR